MATKFKVEKGISSPRRGPRAKYLNYEDLYPLLPKMKPGDSIKIVEVPETRRNSAYLAINGVLQKEFKNLSGSYKVSGIKVGEDKVEIRVFKEADEAPKKKKK